MNTQKDGVIINTVSKFALGRLALERLNLGEVGKMDSFYSKVAAQIQLELKVHAQNLNQLDFNYQIEQDALHNALEDAEQDYASAKSDVDVSKINTNKDQIAYAKVFLDNLDMKINQITACKWRIDEAQKVYAQSADDINKQVESLDKRLSEIKQE